METPLVILAEEDSPLYGGIADIRGPIAVISGMHAAAWLQRDYPDKAYLTVETIDEAIKAVARGKAEAFVGNVASINYSLHRLGITHLKIAGYSEYRLALHMAVRKDWPELVEILSQQLSAMSEVEKRQIISSWINLRVQKQIDWAKLTSWILGISIIAGAIISFFVYTNRKLAREIIERKRVEAALKQAKEAAEASDRAKSDFLATMSHEFRTPMNAILGFTEILQSRLTDPSHLHYSETIHNCGKALLCLLNDVLEISKVEVGKLSLDYQPISIQQLVEEVNTVFAQKMQEKGLEFSLEISGQVPGAVLLDEARLRQVLLNLIGNAYKFTERGFIRLEVDGAASATGGDLVDLTFIVSDSGVGIARQEQERIFGLFERLQERKLKVQGGVGLGLAISRRLIEMMHGSLTVESEPDRGSAFRIHLPNIQVTAEPALAAPETLDVGQVVFEPAKLLIVDDIDYNRDILRTYLEQQPLELVEAENGKIALELLDSQGADLLLLDMNMPVMDGYEAAGKLKADARWKETPIIAVTASALQRDEETIARLCDGYLSKPVSKTDLFRKLMEFLPYSVAAELKEVEREMLTDQPQQPDTAGEQAGTGAESKARILLAEDNEINQELANEVLKEMGAEVTIANDGKEALELAQQQPFDLILMDLQMPEMDGLEATRAIRALGGTYAELPIWAMSADAWADIQKECLAAGMNGGVSKPLDLPVLQERLRELGYGGAA